MTVNETPIRIIWQVREIKIAHRDSWCEHSGAGRESRTPVLTRASGAKSHRSRANQVYLNSALAALSLMDDENHRVYGWLVGITGDEPDWQSRIRFRRVILIELGRIEDRDNLLEAARLICEAKPTTSEAVAMIRRWRLSRSAKGTVDGLKGELIRHLNDYLKRYPETPLEDVHVAVSRVLVAVEQSAVNA